MVTEAEVEGAQAETWAAKCRAQIAGPPAVVAMEACLGIDGNRIDNGSTAQLYIRAKVVGWTPGCSLVGLVDVLYNVWQCHSPRLLGDATRHVFTSA